MREIPLTQGKVALVDEEDYERVMAVGSWRADLNCRHWYAKGSVKLSTGEYYSLPMHRFIMGLEKGDSRKVDHKDRVNTLDNRKSNLRVTLDQNSQNMGLPKHNTSGFKGVCWNKHMEKWQAFIQVKSKKIYLGHFPNLELAAQIYDSAATELHGDFAVTNASLGLLNASAV
ncbi:MAG: AP2 domain-containing protein [Candidatus Sulfotelmatobacter sp.]